MESKLWLLPESSFEMLNYFISVADLVSFLFHLCHWSITMFTDKWPKNLISTNNKHSSQHPLTFVSLWNARRYQQESTEANSHGAGHKA